MLTEESLLRSDASGSGGRLYHLAAMAPSEPTFATAGEVGYMLAAEQRVIQTVGPTFALEGGAPEP